MKAVLTYQDYVALPDDGRRYEIVEGELAVTPSPGRSHQEVVLGLASSLRAHVRERRLGRIYIAPLDVILTESTIVQPDIIFVSGDRLEAFSSRGLEGAPTLAIEVLSPSTSRTDRGTKRELYARYGLPYYWIVDPEDRWIEVHDLARGADSVVSRFTGSAFASPPPFPGLLIDASSIWDS